MLFVDQARIFVKAGNGGQGCESFYRDKYMRHPKPDGGDGGRGGNVIFTADRNIKTLLDFKFKQHYKAPSGGHASSKGKKGREGKDCILKTPVGTLLKDETSGLLIKDLTLDLQSVIVARGGCGGIGNERNRIPVPFTHGEERIIKLELKIMADIGIIGFPNAGKSTLISNISKVQSKTASYPFTTKQPVLGMVHCENFDIIVADLPGIIEGAHQGRGLGDHFLRHAERTKILVHVIDMAGTEGRDPLEDYEKLNHELSEYGHSLVLKHKIIAANKMDLPEASKHLKRFKQKYKENIIVISAARKQGLKELVEVFSKAYAHFKKIPQTN